MVRKLIWGILVLTLIYTGCFNHGKSFTEIDVYIYSRRDLDELKLILRDDVLPKGLLDSLFFNKGQKSIDIKELPGKPYYIVYQLYDYLGNLRESDTTYNNYIDFNMEDGVYTMHLKFLHEETDSLLKEGEHTIVHFEESYNWTYYSDSGFIPILTITPEDYFYTIVHFPIVSIPIIVSSDTFYIESPFKFCCRDLTIGEEIWKNFDIKFGTVTFNFNN